MANETACMRRHPRISLPKGMFAAWYGAVDHQVCCVKTLGMGGVFIATPNPLPVDTNLRLVFEVPGGSFQAEAVVRSVSPGEGMGVQFTRMRTRDRVLLQQLLRRLLR